MHQISIKEWVLLLFLGLAVANSLSVTDWFMEGENIELHEQEKPDSENEEEKPTQEKDEILDSFSLKSFYFMLSAPYLRSNQSTLFSFHCREVPTPPPDFIG